MSYTDFCVNLPVESLTWASNRATVTPQFNCPSCHAQNPVSYTTTIPSNKPLNFNSQIVFSLPCCGAKVTLFVAVHKSQGLNDMKLCLSQTAVAAGWWMGTE